MTGNELLDNTKLQDLRPQAVGSFGVISHGFHGLPLPELPTVGLGQREEDGAD